MPKHRARHQEICSACPQHKAAQGLDHSVRAGKKAAAAAATQAYEAHLDLALDLGWAYLEALCYQVQPTA